MIKNRHNSNYEKTTIIPELDISKKERDEAIKLMRSIFEVQSFSGDMKSMSDFIINYIDNLKDNSISMKTDVYGNIYVVKGIANTYPCIVSHIDTVHHIIPEKDYLVVNSDTKFFAINKELMCRTGIGGDDKNGIYCCLDNLVREPVIKLAFFVDEEIGCVGSSVCDMQFFKDVSFVLQADRQGYKDVADRILGDVMFTGTFFEAIYKNLVEYGRDICDGGMTDVWQLSNNGVEVSVANFSCGYYKPHTSDEYVVIDELILTSILFRDIIASAYLDGEVYKEETPLPHIYSYGYGDYYSTQEVKNKGDKSEGFDLLDKSCHFCGDTLVYDPTVSSYFCTTCLDYDYTKNPY